MTTHISRVDANQPQIVEALRKCGCLVRSTAALGQGFADLIVLTPRKNLVLLEVKTDRGKLTDDQVLFHAAWPVTVVRTVTQALRECDCLIQDSEI